MKISHRAFAAALTIGCIGASAGSANPITYTLDGDFTGTLNGSDFSTHATFTAVSDTSTAYDGGYYTSLHLTSLSADASGTTYTVLGDLGFFNNPGAAAAGFSSLTDFDFLDFSSPVFATFDPTTSLAPTSVSVFYLGSFDTDHGAVSLSDASNLVFSASVGAAVPEPASWALMLGGFGLVGGAMRSRRAKTAVNFG